MRFTNCGADPSFTRKEDAWQRSRIRLRNGGGRWTSDKRRPRNDHAAARVRTCRRSSPPRPPSLQTERGVRVAGGSAIRASCNLSCTNDRCLRRKYRPGVAAVGTAWRQDEEKFLAPSETNVSYSGDPMATKQWSALVRDNRPWGDAGFLDVGGDPALVVFSCDKAARDFLQANRAELKDWHIRPNTPRYLLDWLRQNVCDQAAVTAVVDPHPSTHQGREQSIEALISEVASPG